MRVILVRHGETFENVKRVIQGHLDTELNDNGVEQAQRVATRLKDEKIAAVYSSDLSRAFKTAQEIASHHDLTIQKDHRLRERSFGSLEGKTVSTRDWENLPADVEKRADLSKRATEFIKDIFESHQGETVVAVSHGGTCMSLLAHVHGLSHHEMDRFRKIPNTAVNIFIKNPDGSYEVELVACDEHLIS